MLCQNNFMICSIWMLFSQLKIYQGQPTANLMAITVISTDPFPNPKNISQLFFENECTPTHRQAVALHRHHHPGAHRAQPSAEYQVSPQSQTIIKHYLHSLCAGLRQRALLGCSQDTCEMVGKMKRPQSPTAVCKAARATLPCHCQVFTPFWTRPFYSQAAVVSPTTLHCSSMVVGPEGFLQEHLKQRALYICQV